MWLSPRKLQTTASRNSPKIDFRQVFVSHPGEHILVVDFGSQTTQLIARRVRECGVYCEIQPYDVSSEVVENFEPAGFILSGGPESVTENFSPRIPDHVLRSGRPILGICYGMHALVEQLGGVVDSSELREFGPARINLTAIQGVLPKKERVLDVWMSHGDRVTELPMGFAVSASSDDCPIAAISNESEHQYGVQFHPEVTHTDRGLEIIDRFVRNVCGCQRTWVPEHIVSMAVEQIREEVGDENVILGLSGGVDSSVTAALVSRAIGSQLKCVLVDNGLMRKDEVAKIEETMGPSNALPIELQVVDAKDRFLNALQGVKDPEDKRKIVGRTFIEVFEESARELDSISWLAQGTIYPDVVESAATKFGKSHVIKSHHNVGGLPDRLNLKLLEPLRELFKDEVRKIGLELGLPDELINRHPFPGPGLSVRILGEVKQEYIDILREADAIFLEELRKAGWMDRVSQAFAVFIPVKSVAVVGDARAYEYVIALRSVSTTDFMTADWSDLPHELLGKIASRIMNEVARVSRVVYDVSSKPPSTIEWE